MTETTAAIIIAGFQSVMVASLLFALWKGGAAERAGAVLIIVMAVIQLGTRAFIEPRFDRTDLIPLVVDAIGFAGFAWIGLHARRYWPLIAAALQLLSLAGHFARAVHFDVHPMAYAVMKSGPTFAIFILLVIGTANACRRRRVRRL